MTRPVPVFVTYRPKKGKEARFLALLRRHGPALRKASLIAPGLPRVWLARDKRSGRRYYLESFSWADEAASDRAHEQPDVLAVWGPMMPLLEAMEIAVVEELAPPALTARTERSRRRRTGPASRPPRA